MNRVHFQKIKREFGNSPSGNGHDISVAVSAKIGKLHSLSAHETIVMFDADGDLESFPYSSVDILDEDGEIVECPITDMTGREIKEEDIIVFILESEMTLGRVKRTLSTGGVRVTILMRNNKRAMSDRDVFVNFPEKKVMRLPISGNALFAWHMMDFDSNNEYRFVPDDRS